MKKKLWNSCLTFGICLLALLSALPLGAQDRGLEVLAREITGKADFEIGRQVAVIIGIDKYLEWPSLRSAVSEAKALKKVLDERYVIDEFIELYDEGASAANIRKLFVQILPAKLGPKDSLLVFYAGHGQTDESKTGFWIASDGSKDVFSQNNWIPNAQLRNMIGNLKAQRILILADACFSGDFLNVNRGATPTIDNAYYRKALQLTARQVLTSGTSESVPDDSEFGHQLLNLLERNDEPLLDPISMYERVRLGVTKTIPLLGTLPGNEQGASFVLFLREAGRASGQNATSTTTPAAVSLAVPKGSADLMVKTDEPGADVFIDGVLRGRSPLLVKKLDAGRILSIVARTATKSGSLEFTLIPGDITEVSIPLKVLTGNLVIKSNEYAVNLFIDGVDKGTFGSGLFKAIPIGPRRIELKGKDLYGEVKATVIEGQTVEVNAFVRPMANLAFDAPSDTIIRVKGMDWSMEQKGGDLCTVPAGLVSLSASGADYLPVETTTNLSQGQSLSWKPWKGGRIEFDAKTVDALCSIDGAAAIPANKVFDSVAPGTHKLLFTKAGCRDSFQTISVSLGKSVRVAVSLERFKPARISFPDFSIKLGIEAPRDVAWFEAGAWSVVSGLPIKLGFSSPYAESIDLPAIEASFAEGELKPLSLPSGRIELPWIPAGAKVAIGSGRSLELQNEAESGFRSPDLPPGSYTLSVGDVYRGKVTIPAKGIADSGDYRKVMAQKLSTDRTIQAKSLSAKRGKTAWGWTSFAVGILGAAGSGAIYYLGSEAMTAYDAALDTASAIAYAKVVKTYRTLFPISAAVGGIGLGLSPILWFGGPNPKVLEDSIKTLDEGIKALGK